MVYNNSNSQLPLSPSKQSLLLLSLFLGLVLLRIPYFWNYNIQEDAYVHWRVAFNFVETGTIGFNPHERVGASTSYAYVFIAAAVRWLSGDAFIIVILLLNTAVLILATYLVALCVYDNNRLRILFWLVFSITPIAFIVSYRGMETPYLILAIAVILKALHSNQEDWKSLAALCFLPWIRPDAVAYGLILVLFMGMKRSRIPIRMLSALTLGTVTLLLFNQIYFGQWLNQTIVAKLLFMREELTFVRVMDRLLSIFSTLYIPLESSRYLKSLAPIFTCLLFSAFGLCLWRLRKLRRDCYVPGALVALSIAIPIAYAIGGVVYPWYFWPSTLFGYGIISILVSDWLSSTRNCVSQFLRYALMFLLLGGLDVALYLYTFSGWWCEIRLYKDITGYINASSKREESMMLEPIGSIPFYTGLYTHDERALASPRVLEFRLRFGDRWYSMYLKTFKPTYLILRDDIFRGMTTDGVTLSAAEKAWFDKNYELIRTFRSDPENFPNMLLKFTSRSWCSLSFYLFQETRP